MLATQVRVAHACPMPGVFPQESLMDKHGTVLCLLHSAHPGLNTA